MDEQSQFLKDLGIDDTDSILNKPLDIPGANPEKEEPVRRVELDEDGYPKNRLGRRRRSRDEERDGEIQQLTQRIQQLSEVQKFKEEVGDDPLKKIEAIFGTDTPEKLAATMLLKEAMQGLSEKTKAEILKASEAKQEEAEGAQKEADDEVDDMLERVEDDYNLDMSDKNTREGYITLMERMSPKYKDGNVKEFADADAVAEAYIELQKRQSSSRARELAGRSMTRSGESQPSKLPQNSVDRFMEEHGLGW